MIRRIAAAAVAALTIALLLAVAAPARGADHGANGSLTASNGNIACVYNKDLLHLGLCLGL